MYIKNDEFWLFDGFEPLRDADPDRLNKAIELVSREIDEYCNTRFEPTEDFYALDLCRSFYTRCGPLLEVLELSLGGTVLAPETEFFVYPESSRVELDESVTAGSIKKALTVRYSYGYRTVPAIVKQVAAELIKLDAESNLAPVQGLRSESWDGEYSYTRNASKDFTPAALRRSILARLDGFIVPPYTRSGGARNVRARFL